MSDTALFWVAVVGLAFSGVGLVTGVASLAMSLIFRRQLSPLGFLGLLFGLLSMPLNASQVWRLWP